MNYADVAIDADWIPAGKTFSYRIPRHLAVEPGQLVWVQFGRSYVQGVVVSLSEASAVSEEETRDILHPIEPSPLIGSLGLELAEWVGQTYLCSPFEALAPMLPPGFRTHQRSRLTAVSGPDDEANLGSFRESTREAWAELLAAGNQWGERDFVRRIDANRPNVGQRELQRLVDRGMVSKQVSLPRPRTHRYRRHLVRSGHESAEADAPDAVRANASRQIELVGCRFGSLWRRTMLRGLDRSRTRCWNAGLIAEEWQRVKPEAPTGSAPTASLPAALTDAQERALARITKTLDDPGILPRSVLLHGVTGSGKTEVYLRAIAHAVGLGKQAIYLVPEIALTPQTVGLVNDRFPGRTAVLHHRLTERERFDQWWDIRDGLKDVVVGPRSALFAPTFNLGLIIVDEEHEPAYKQEEFAPHYHARDAGVGAGSTVWSGRRDGIGDARCLHISRCASRGRHHLMSLPDRVPGPDGVPIPLAETQMVDMRRELREGNRSVFSRPLIRALDTTIAAGQQAVLFLNRRGSAAFMQCRECGCVVTCSRCSVAYAYHAETRRLLCHYCNHSRQAAPGVSAV